MNGYDKGNFFAAAKIAEVERVNLLIVQDRFERVREQDRQRATLEVKDGVFVNLVDTVIEPTPEWGQHGDFRTFTPRVTDGTARVLKSVRRVLTPVIQRLLEAGKLSDEQAAACRRYRLIYEVAGLCGCWSSSQFSPTSSVSRSTKAGGFAGHMARHMAEAEARAEFRAARESIIGGHLRFFEEIVVLDASPRMAARFGRIPIRKAESRLRLVAQRLAEHFDAGAATGHSGRD